MSIVGEVSGGKKHNLHCLSGLTKARLKDVIPVDSLYVGLVRHVSAEAISGRHGCSAFLELCNPRIQR